MSSKEKKEELAVPKKVTRTDRNARLARIRKEMKPCEGRRRQGGRGLVTASSQASSRGGGAV